MTRILPALLGDTTEVLDQQFEAVSGLSNVLHYDLADGVFVGQRTLPPSDYPQPRVGQQIVWHFMVDALPEQFLADCLHISTQAVIIHAEATQLPEMIDALTAKQVSIGLALNPETPVVRVTPWLKQIHFVQLMTVHPGKQGQVFLSDALTKIVELRASDQHLRIGLDGGVNRDTISQLAPYGLDYVVVGSALTKAENPSLVYQELSQALA